MLSRFLDCELPSKKAGSSCALWEILKKFWRLENDPWVSAVVFEHHWKLSLSSLLTCDLNEVESSGKDRDLCCVQRSDKNMLTLRISWGFLKVTKMWEAILTHVDVFLLCRDGRLCRGGGLWAVQTEASGEHKDVTSPDSHACGSAGLRCGSNNVWYVLSREHHGLWRPSCTSFLAGGCCSTRVEY